MLFLNDMQITLDKKLLLEKAATYAVALEERKSLRVQNLNFFIVKCNLMDSKTCFNGLLNMLNLSDD